MVKRILVLDGGGVKGVITLKFLSLLEKNKGINVSTYFDLFAGTSTGGLIASLFAHKGLSATEILEKVYTLDTVKKIMSQGYYEWALSQIQFCSKYNDVEKRSFIKLLLDGEEDSVKMSDVSKPLLLVAFNPTKKVPIFFRSYFHSPDYLLSEACNATSAAPTYFPLARVTLPKTSIHRGEPLKCNCPTDPPNNPLFKIGVNSRQNTSENGTVESQSYQHEVELQSYQHEVELQGNQSEATISYQPKVESKYNDSDVTLSSDIPKIIVTNTETQASDSQLSGGGNNITIDNTLDLKVVEAETSVPSSEELKPNNEYFWAIDGGIFANNPSDLAYLDAKTLFNGEKLELLSVGTGICKSKFHKVTNPCLGGWDWMIDDHLIDLLLDSNQVTSHIRAKHLCRNGGDMYLRVNEYLRLASSDLDNTTIENYDKLLEEGELWWRLYSRHSFITQINSNQNES